MKKITDTQAVDALHALLNGEEWDSDTFDTMAMILETAGRPIADPNDIGWHQGHRDAMTHPSVREEPLVLMIRGVEAYIANGERFNGGGQWRDGGLTPAVADILKGIQQLLAGDVGRLDPSTVSHWVEDTADRVGWNLETDDWRQPDCV